MEQTLHLNLPLHHPPGVGSAGDPCVSRLLDRLSSIRGVREAHLEQRDGQPVLCLHFDPGILSLAKLERLAHEAGTDVGRRYRHEQLRVVGMDCGDCAFSIEHVLSRRPGVLHVSVDYASEMMEIAY